MKSQGFHSHVYIFIFLKSTKCFLVVNHVEMIYSEGKKEIEQSNIQSDNCEMIFFLFFTTENVVHLIQNIWLTRRMNIIN